MGACMKFDSIAMIETNGFVSSIVALEAMLKIENIRYLKSKVITNGQVTVFVSGKIGDLKHAIIAGNIAAKETGKLISSSIIENPTSDIMNIIYDKKVENGNRRSKVKTVKQKEKSLTLFDDINENPIVSESIKNHKNTDFILEEEVSIDKTIVDSVDSGLNKKNPKDISTKDIKELRAENEDELHKNVEFISHLDRLKAEAKIEIEKEKLAKKDESYISTLSEEKIDSIQPEIVKIKTSKKSQNEIISNSELEENHDEYAKLNVPQLRKLARGNPEFPIKGREISKANRMELLSYFKQIKK